MSAPESCSPDQLFLLPPSLVEWLPEEHPVHIVSEVVDQLELSPVAAAAQPGPTWPDPRAMVKILFYAYVSGIHSSRGIAQRCLEDVGFRVLSWNVAPEFGAISAFRRLHRPGLQQLFLQIVRCCRQLGLKHLGDLPLNGANGTGKGTARRSGRSSRTASAYGHLIADIEAFFAQADETDAAEDRSFGANRKGDGLPSALRGRSTRRHAIREAVAGLSLEEVEAAPAPRARARSRQSPATKAAAKRATPPPPEATMPTASPRPPESEGEGQELKGSGFAIPESELAQLLEEPLPPSSAEATAGAPSEDASTSQVIPVVELPPVAEGSPEPPDGARDSQAPDDPSKPFILSYVTGGLRVDAPVVRATPTASTLAENRRRDTRLRMPDRYPAKLQLRDVDLIDVSSSGALVEHVGSVRPGQIYQLSFGLEGRQIHTQARAVRGQANRLGPSENGERRIVYRTALEFVRIDNGDSELIAAYIERMLAEPAVST
jgi:transposase